MKDQHTTRVAQLRAAIWRAVAYALARRLGMTIATRQTLAAAERTDEWLSHPEALEDLLQKIRGLVSEEPKP